MKTKSLLLGLSLLSSSAMAGTYNVQLDFDYFDSDGDNALGLTGAYYLKPVNTAGKAWSEAAFMGRNNNISASYFDYDNGATAINLSGEFFGDSRNNLYGKVGVTSVDYDFEPLSNFDDDRDTVLHGELGYFLQENWLVSVATTSSDGVDPIYVKTKYIGKLGNGKFFNVEAQIDDEEHDLTVAGDYFWSPQSSAGLELSNAEGYDYGLRFQHFFDSNIAVKVSYIATDFDDVYGIGLVGRF